MADGKRSFWLHQFAEYLIAGILVASGLQSPTPLVPAMVGGLLAVDAAFVDGPLSAFRGVPRRIHQFFDWVMLAVIFVAAALAPGVESSLRFVMAGVGVVYGFVVFGSDYSRKAKVRASTEPGAGGRSETAGRFAGRLAGRGVQAYRSRRPGPG